MVREPEEAAFEDADRKTIWACRIGTATNAQPVDAGTPDQDMVVLAAPGSVLAAPLTRTLNPVDSLHRWVCPPPTVTAFVELTASTSWTTWFAALETASEGWFPPPEVVLPEAVAAVPSGVA
jgi:hypothetical protein